MDSGTFRGTFARRRAGAAWWGLVAVLLLGVVVRADIALTRVDGVDETFSFLSGRPGSLWFTCLVWVTNSTTPGENSTAAPSEVQYSVVAEFTGNIERMSVPYVGPNGDCSSRLSNNVSNITFNPVSIPLDIPSGSSSVIYRAMFPFCYHPDRAGQDILGFRCKVNNDMTSPPHTVTVNISDSRFARGLYFGMAPFVFIFIFILICNMVIWRRVIQRRARQQQQHREQREIRNELFQQALESRRRLEQSMGSEPAGLTPQALACIPKVTITAEMSDILKEMCVICQSEFAVGEEIKELNCKHQYHAACIDEWLKKSTHCPICITEVSLV